MPPSPLLTINLMGWTLEVTWLTLFGLSGNVLFTTRMLVQWFASERHGRTVVPVSFWWLSLTASIIFIAYAFGRRDVPFVLGVAVTIVPYTRNLMIHYRPHRPPRPLGVLVLAAVVLACIPQLASWRAQSDRDGWLLFGFLANAVFCSRFFVQWVQSESRRKPVMSRSFWYVSLGGSVMLLIYSIARGDLVFILAFTFNAIPYTRNLLILHRQQRTAANARA